MFRLLVIVAILAHIGGLRIAQFGSQWRAYLTKPGTLLASLVVWGACEAIIKFFSK